MIQIIAGTYGQQKGGKIIPVTKENGTIKLSPEEESRLVKRGIAVYVEGEKEAQTYEITENQKEQREYHTLKFAELKEIAAENGIDTSSMRSKEEIINALNTQNEEAPILAPADLVDE